MENTQKTNPKFFFLSLGVLVTLITTVVSFLNLVFSTLDKRFPDVLNATYAYGYNTYDFTAMRSALATLIIIFPVFFVLSYFWNKIIKQGLSHSEATIKKWMLYLIIFLSSIIIVVDLVTLVRYFVEGEITTRFIFKVVVTLVIALHAGKYYIYKLKETPIKKTTEIVFASFTTALVIISIVYAFMVMGSPFKQRQLRLDDRRVQDLMSVQSQVINYYQQKEKLPETLDALATPLSGYALPVDPEFEKGFQYEYKVIKPLSFELCATFSLPMPQGWQEYSNGGIVYPAMPVAIDSSYPYPGRGVNDSWDHQVGRTCFERTIDKDMYPPYPKPLQQ